MLVAVKTKVVKADKIYTGNLHQCVNLVETMNGYHESLNDGGSLHITVPVKVWDDPLAVRMVTEATLRHFCSRCDEFSAHGESMGIKPFSNMSRSDNGGFVSVVLFK